MISNLVLVLKVERHSLMTECILALVLDWLCNLSDITRLLVAHSFVRVPHLFKGDWLELLKNRQNRRIAVPPWCLYFISAACSKSVNFVESLDNRSWPTPAYNVVKISVAGKGVCSHISTVCVAWRKKVSSDSETAIHYAKRRTIIKSMCDIAWC